MQEIFLWSVRVYYEDTDAGGVVYHSNYLNFMERARTEWLRQKGWGQERLYREQGVLFAVAQMEIRFLAPARLDDLLTISVEVSQQKPASLSLKQTIFRAQDQRQLLEAGVRIVALNGQFKPIRWPEGLFGD